MRSATQDSGGTGSNGIRGCSTANGVGDGLSAVEGQRSWLVFAMASTHWGSECLMQLPGINHQ
eukprot:8866257-Karenia_brevis.AAC.1